MNARSAVPAHRAVGFLLLVGLFIVLAVSSTPSAAAPAADPEVVVSSPVDGWTAEQTFLYWADRCPIIGLNVPTQEQSVLQRKPIAGGATRTLGTDPSCSMYSALAADETGVYYTDRDSPGAIYRQGIAAADAGVPIVTNAGSQVDEIMLDSTYVYWTAVGDKIYRAPKSGGSPQVIIDADNVIVDFHVDGASLYWLEFGGGFGWAPQKACGSPPCSFQHFPGVKGTILRPGRPALAGDPPFMYYVETGSQQLRRLQCRNDIDACSFTVLHDAPTGWSIGDFVPLCIPGRFGACFDDTHVFLTEKKDAGSGSRVVRVQLSGGSDEIAVGITFLPNIHLAGGYVYFAEATLPDAGIYRLPFNAPAIERDFRAVAVEVNQAIQNLNNEVPLVAAKPTYVRVYGEQLKGPPALSVEALLYGERNGQPLPDSPLRPLNGPLEMQTGSGFDRGDEDGGWLFALPRGWTLTSQLELEAVIDPRESYADLSPENNRKAVTVAVTGEPDACLFFSPVRTHTALPSYNDPNFWPTLDRFVSLWPVPGADVLWFGEPIEELETCWWGIAPYPCFRPYELDQGWDWDNWFSDSDRVIAKLIARQAVARVESPFRCVVGASVHSVGMVHPQADTTDDQNRTTYGYANYFFNASWTKFPPHTATPSAPTWTWPDAGSTFAQEITHNFWRKHVDCNNPEGIDDDYPYDPCKLDDRDLAAPSTYYGFDSVTRQPIAPDQAADFMSYASDTWVSDYTYKGVKGEFNLLARVDAARETAAAELAQAGEVAIITGFYEPNLALGRLNYAYIMPTADLSPANLAPLAAPRWAAPGIVPLTSDEPLPGRLLVKNAAGETLADRTLELIPNDDHSHEMDGFFFAAAFPAPDEPVALVQMLVGGKVVAELEPGSGVPQVQVQAPAAGAALDQSITVRWRATDPDGDILLYHVHYSPDDGENWFPLVTDYPGAFGSDQVSLTLQNPHTVPGSSGQARIKVTASDGFNSAAALSGLFSVAPRAPQAFISVPAPEQVFDAGEAVPLQGAAYDAEEGSLADEQLFWEIEGSPVGAGGIQTAAGLAPGRHEVELTAEDGDGQQDTATAEVEVLPLLVPLAENSPTLDGRCDDSRYTAAARVRLSPFGGDGGQVTVRLLRTGSHLWACFTGLEIGQSSNALAALLLDGNYSRGASTEAADALYGIFDDGSPTARKGNGSGFMNVNIPSGFEAKVSAESATMWQAELRLAQSLIANWNGEVGLAFYATRPDGATARAYWPHLPPQDLRNEPRLWARALLVAAPVLDNLTPQTATVGDGQLALTLTGRNFGEGAAVLWDGTPVPTTRSSENELLATVPAGLLNAAGSFPVKVRVPGLETFPSNTRVVTVLNPQPVITTLTPDKVDAGSGALTMTVAGSGFVPGARVLWDGEEKPTTFVSNKKLEAALSGRDLALGGNIAVVVRNPEPAQGVSLPVIFRVEPNEAAGAPQPLYLPVVVKN